MEVKLQSQAFKQIWETARSLSNGEAEKWKEEGHKIAGYYCSAMPEELIDAAGMLPFRLRGTGSEGTELADAFFSSINCTFSRHSFNQALRGEFDFLDALIMLNSCDNVRRIYDHWIRQFETPFTHFLSLPKKAEPAQVKFFREELSLLKEHLEEHLGREISDGDLREAIKLHNETRRLLRQLYELRKSDAPPIAGADTLAIVVASTAMPKARFNELLTEVLDELHSTKGITDYRARLMIVGGIVDEPEYINVIEDQGGLVVADSICFGSRNFWVDVDESDADPLMALASYYVRDRPSCPRTFGLHEKRAEYIRDMIDQFRVDGIIFQRLTFCDVWGFEQFPLTNDFKEWDFPYLMMDREYTLSAVGQLRTRVQAFLETLGGV